jgi:hypothetical protein
MLSICTFCESAMVSAEIAKVFAWRRVIGVEEDMELV